MDNSLQNHFLIATPSLDGSYFGKTVTYICEHNDHGAMGIVINQRTELTLKQLLNLTDEEVRIDAQHESHLVMEGGPVSRDRGFILHTCQPGWSSSLELTSEIMVTTSKDILRVIGNEQGPEKAIVALGYAGWSAGQLEEELESNSWLTLKADTDILFNVPIEQKWDKAIEKLGINIWQLSPQVGHA
ncbi:YqgE/AlgH family protein [Planctobacterium marinum]|uniref:YqgE/AlgH family protein n=1 Tax=Planctobacterium marinum TaxID=1631968 RepID=UPI001E4DAB0F|nr:YqgE/AlgH family protein [Planctobacterium marinum]MCC2605790.1 YqgE/AlgH family protein [Planctobacterium marinum]